MNKTSNQFEGLLSRYFEKLLQDVPTFATAYATDGENPSSTQLKTQANTLLSQMYEGVVKFIPGGYGPPSLGNRVADLVAQAKHRHGKRLLLRRRIRLSRGLRYRDRGGKRKSGERRFPGVVKP